LGLPVADRADRRHGPRVCRARDRGGHPPHPGNRLRGAADAAGVRVCDPRLRVRPGRHGDGGPHRLRGGAVPGAVGAPCRRGGGRHQLRPRRLLHHLHPHPVRDPGEQRPPQPRVPLLRHPIRTLGSTGAFVVTLPAPNLDDRRFQDLVDDAKRLVQQRCPEWTDHNVSDPGVTLIETFAWMTDQVLYRLNRVPERNYIKFLELIGVRLFPPTAARAAITFWLAGPQPATVHIRPGTQVATLRTESDEAIAFTTIGDLPIVPTSLSYLASSLAGEKEVRDHTEALLAKTSFFCFDKVPKPDDVL